MKINVCLFFNKVKTLRSSISITNKSIKNPKVGFPAVMKIISHLDAVAISRLDQSKPSSVMVEQQKPQQKVLQFSQRRYIIILSVLLTKLSINKYI